MTPRKFWGQKDLDKFQKLWEWRYTRKESGQNRWKAAILVVDFLFMLNLQSLVLSRTFPYPEELSQPRCVSNKWKQEILWNWLICLVTRMTSSWWEKAFCIQKVWNSLDGFPDCISTLWYESSNWGESALWLEIWDLSLRKEKEAKPHQSVFTLVTQIVSTIQLWKSHFSYNSSNAIIVPDSVLSFPLFSLTCPTNHVFLQSP